MSRPAAAETLLRGFIADPDLEDAVLGDLAEEWSERAADAGIEAANDWYRGQALRTAPHLLATWWRSTDARQLLETLGRAALALAAAALLAALTLSGTLIAVGGPSGAPPPVSSPHALALAMILGGAGWALLAGFALAYRTRRAPMAATAVLGSGWIPVTLVPALAFPTPPGAPAWLYLAFPATLLLATAVGGAAATLLRRPDLASRPATEPSTVEAVMMTNTENAPFRRRAARVVVVTALLLMVPLVAMQLTGEVDWNWFDFVFAGTLLLGTGFAYVFATREERDTAYRVAVGAALAAAFLLVWVIAAVGIIGASGDRADMMYGGVLAVGIIGAIIARFRPLGMARALFATALAQVSVGVIALIAGMVPAYNSAYEILGLSGFFAALWLASAWLFRKAARQPSPAGAAPEG